MVTLRRLAHSPTPRRLAPWRAELLTTALLAGGLLGMLNGWG